MPEKCCIYICRRPAELCGYCLKHYEGDITPYKYLTKQQLLDFIQSVQFILSREFRLSLPVHLTPEPIDTYSKAELRELYRETKRFIDMHLRDRLLRASHIRDRPDLHTGDWEAWENLCRIVAHTLFGDILVRPRLPNGTMPDIVPCGKGLRIERTRAGSERLVRAPVIIEVKTGIHHSEVLPKYGEFTKRIELWFYRWRPHWLEHREEGVIYQSPIELAQRLEKGGTRQLASLLRSLPLLWRNYELLPHYNQGLAGGG